MKWLRIFFAMAVFALISCSNPAGPRYPDSEEKDPDKSDPDGGSKTGLLPAPPVNVTFWV